LFDTKTGEEIESNERAHSGTVTDLQLSPDGTYYAATVALDPIGENWLIGSSGSAKGFSKGS
jgi:WD40 repeat protein